MLEGLRLLARLGVAPTTIVDVGASDGRWSKLARTAFPLAELVLFEPQPVHALALERFQVEHPHATIVRSAIGGSIGSSLFDGSDPFGGAFLEEQTPESITVPVVTLDEALATASPPFLVKLDTHGAEAAILAGAQQTLARSVAWIIEAYNQRFHSDCLLFWELCTYMATHGFRAVDVVDVLHRPYDGTLWQMDLFFIRAEWKGFGYLGLHMSPPVQRTDGFWSQWGEDEFLIEHELVPPEGVFVDVGAGDPIRYSNTYYVEQLGWTGLCIDADPAQIEALSLNRRCAVEWAAVSSDEGEVELLRVEDPDYSTTLHHLPALAADRGSTHTVTRVPAVKLETILQKHDIGVIDLLSIDTEGSELDACRTLDWDRHRPRAVVIEYLTWGRPSQGPAIRAFFREMPYRLVHRTTTNFIFVESRVQRLLPRRVCAYLARRDEERFLRAAASADGEVERITTPRVEHVTWRSLTPVHPLL